LIASLIDDYENGLDHGTTSYIMDFKHTNRKFNVGFYRATGK